jgi:hypothetical protein
MVRRRRNNDQSLYCGDKFCNYFLIDNSQAQTLIKDATKFNFFDELKTMYEGLQAGNCLRTPEFEPLMKCPAYHNGQMFVSKTGQGTLTGDMIDLEKLCEKDADGNYVNRALIKNLFTDRLSYM